MPTHETACCITIAFGKPEKKKVIETESEARLLMNVQHHIHFAIGWMVGNSESQSKLTFTMLSSHTIHICKV